MQEANGACPCDVYYGLGRTCEANYDRNNLLKKRSGSRLPELRQSFLESCFVFPSSSVPWVDRPEPAAEVNWAWYLRPRVLIRLEL